MDYLINGSFYDIEDFKTTQYKFNEKITMKCTF